MIAQIITASKNQNLKSNVNFNRAECENFIRNEYSNAPKDKGRLVNVIVTNDETVTIHETRKDAIAASVSADVCWIEYNVVSDEITICRLKNGQRS